MRLIASLAILVVCVAIATANPACHRSYDPEEIYDTGDVASDDNVNYIANRQNLGTEPSLNNGDDGEPWTSQGECTQVPVSPAPLPDAPVDEVVPMTTVGPISPYVPFVVPVDPVAPISPPPAYIFSPYKDVSINMDYNTRVIRSAASGELVNLVDSLPDGVNTVSLAFVSGECGREDWGTIQPYNFVRANFKRFVDAGVKYIISTGGGGPWGTFTCGSDYHFRRFLNRYTTESLIGFDFNIDENYPVEELYKLVERVKNVREEYPNIRFTWTVFSSAPEAETQSLAPAGLEVIKALKAAGLTDDQYINLMVMDYGSTDPDYCVIGADNKCSMGASAIQAAKNLHAVHGWPYHLIELTPMIGENDYSDQTFRLSDIDTMMEFVNENQLGGVHYWSYDRDTPCAHTQPDWHYPTDDCIHLEGSEHTGFAKAFAAAGPSN